MSEKCFRIQARNRICLVNSKKDEMSDMSDLGANMSGQSLWNSVRGPDMSGLTGVFGGKIKF
jgi:hypothetical protein